MGRLLRPPFAAMVCLAVCVAIISSCAEAGDTTAEVPVDADGFPTEWPIERPPGRVDGCANGSVTQEEALFSVVLCLPDEPDPFTASQEYLATLEGDGFTEREPGAFITRQETFFDGNGIEVYYQLVDDEATIVLIKPAD